MLEISALMNWLKYFFLYNSISKENIKKLNQESVVAASENGGFNWRGAWWWRQNERRQKTYVSDGLSVRLLAGRL